MLNLNFIKQLFLIFEIKKNDESEMIRRFTTVFYNQN
jgi:hypothetical protein